MSITTLERGKFGTGRLLKTKSEDGWTD